MATNIKRLAGMVIFRNDIYRQLLYGNITYRHILERKTNFFLSTNKISIDI